MSWLSKKSPFLFLHKPYPQALPKSLAAVAKAPVLPARDTPRDVLAVDAEPQTMDVEAGSLAAPGGGGPESKGTTEGQTFLGYELGAGASWEEPVKEEPELHWNQAAEGQRKIDERRKGGPKGKVQSSDQNTGKSSGYEEQKKRLRRF